MNDYTTIPLRGDTFSVLAHIRRIRDNFPESYDNLIWRLVALAGRSIQAQPPLYVQVKGPSMSDYTTITLRRDTVAALARIRETRNSIPESYDHLIRRLVGLPERSMSEEQP
jgi:hypothetical protein